MKEKINSIIDILSTLAYWSAADAVKINQLLQELVNETLDSAIEIIAEDSNIHRIDANRLASKIRALKIKE